MSAPGSEIRHVKFRHPNDQLRTQRLLVLIPPPSFSLVRAGHRPSICRMKTFSPRRASQHRVTISWLAGWLAPSSQSNNFTTQHLAIPLPSVLVVARSPELLLIVSHSASSCFSPP